MIAHTSLAAYHDTDRTCLRAYIAGVIAANAPVTRRQIAKITGLETSCVAGRVNELLMAGQIKELPETMPCPISGRRVKVVISA